MNKSILMALIVVVALGLWMSSGGQSNANTPAKVVTIQAEKARMKVSVIQSNVQPVERYVTVQGQVEASRSIEIKAEIEGRVESFKAVQGQRLDAGATILKLADDYRLKQLSQAKAVLRQRNSDYNASVKLKKRGLLAQNRLIADQAAVETARAELALVQHEVDNALISAPFAGVLNSRSVELGDYLQKGSSIGVLVDDSELKVTGQVPQQNIAGLSLNQAVEITLSNNLVAMGNLSFISRVGDTQTRSYRVEVTLQNPEFKRLIGLTATLRLPLGQELGHLLPNSVLGLSANGDLNVKVLDSENVVDTVVVELIRTDSQGFWLKGIADQARVISIGKDFVTRGEQVDPVTAKPISIVEKTFTPVANKG